MCFCTYYIKNLPPFTAWRDFMNVFQEITKRCIALVLSLVLMLSFSAVAFAATDSATDSEISSGSSGGTTTDTQTPKEPDRIHAGYSFDDRNDLTAEVGKTYPLSSKEFGTALLSGISGHRNGAMSGYVTLDDRLFDTLEQLSVGFWTAFDRSDIQSKDTIFLVSGTKSEKIEVSFKNETNKVKLYLTVSDGKKTASCSQDVTDVFGEDRSWAHIAFTYKKSGSVSLLTLYVNGKSASSSISTTFVDLTGIKCETAAFYGIPVDELYLTDYALEPAKVASLMNQAVSVFYASESKEIAGGTSAPEGGTVDTPAVNAHTYTWAAYLFDGTFAAGSDLYDSPPFSFSENVI